MLNLINMVGADASDGIDFDRTVVIRDVYKVKNLGSWPRMERGEYRVDGRGRPPNSVFDPLRLSSVRLTAPGRHGLPLSEARGQRPRFGGAGRLRARATSRGLMAGRSICRRGERVPGEILERTAAPPITPASGP